MIRAESVPGGVALVGDLPLGAVGYVDADWIDADAPGAVPALVASGGALCWSDGPDVTSTQAEGDAAAAAAISAVAKEAAALAAGAPADRVEVTGVGFAAEHVRRLLGVTEPPHYPDHEQRPTVIVEMTGAASVIKEATRRLDDMGTLVLAGESSGRSLSLNLYRDVHSRGLRVVGVGRADVLEAVEGFEPPAAVTPGTPLPPARWYRISAAG